MSEQTFEGLLADGYNLAGTSTIASIHFPFLFLFLAKESVPAIYLRLPQFRNWARLVDSTSNPPMPGGAPFPPPTPR